MNSPCAKVLGQRPKTLVRRKSAAAQKGRWAVLLQRYCQSELSILTVPCEKKGLPIGSPFFFSFRRLPAGLRPIPTAPVRRRRTGALLLCNLFPHFRKEKKSGLRFAIFRQLSRKPNSLSGFALWKTLWKLWITPGMQSYQRSYGNHFTSCVPRIFRSFTRVLHWEILRPSPALYKTYRKAARPRRELSPPWPHRCL